MNPSRRWDQYWQENPHRAQWLQPDETVAALTKQLQRKHPTLHRVLDLGCGLGRHTIFFAQQGFQVHGVDNSPDALAHCSHWLKREGLAAVLLLADMTVLPYRDGLFDFILSYYVMHHGTLETMMRTFREAHRILAPGGLFYANFWSSDAQDKMKGTEIEPRTFVYTSGEEAGIAHHFTSPAELEDFLHGFEVLKKERQRHWRILIRKPVHR